MKKIGWLPFVLFFSLSSCLDDLDFEIPTQLGTLELDLSNDAFKDQYGFVGLTEGAIDSVQVNFEHYSTMLSENEEKRHQGNMLIVSKTLDDQYAPFVYIYRQISEYDGIAFEPNKKYRLSPRGEFCHMFVGTESPYEREYLFKWTAQTEKPTIVTDEDGIFKIKGLDLASSEDFFEIPLGFYRDPYSDKKQESGEGYTWYWADGFYTFKTVTADAEGKIWVIIGAQRTLSDYHTPTDASYSLLLDEIELDVYAAE